MPLIIDDLLFGIPFLITVWRAASARSRARSGDLPEHGMSVAECRAAIPADPGLKRTPAMRGGYFYSGNDPEHVQYLHAFLDTIADDEVSGEARRRVLAFKALQGREGSTAAINTYDNQVFTWGTGWGGLGMLPAVMDKLVTSSQAVVDALASCGVHYLGHGRWSVETDDGHVVQGQKEALEVIRSSPALQNLFIAIAKDPHTRDDVTRAQLDTFMEKSGNVPGSEMIATQALFNFVTHLKHWAPGYVTGLMESVNAQVPGSPSVERDAALVPKIIEHFYGRASGWIPAWKQMQGYVLRDMKEDGLDVSRDPVVTAATHPPTGVKTAGGCGDGGIGALQHKTAGGCGNNDFPALCVNAVTLSEFYPPVDPPAVVPVKVVSGPGQSADVPPGYEYAREILVEPNVEDLRKADGWGETFDPNDPWRHTRRAQGPTTVNADQLAAIKRGIVEAVRQGDFDAFNWTQIQVGNYALMVMNEPIAVHGLRLPTSFDDAVKIGYLINALPITPAISDARFAQAKKVYAPSQGLGDPRGALHDDPEQIVKYNEMMGPNTGEFRDGFWKEVTLSERLQKSGKGSMAQYGFKTSDSHMFEHGGPSNHFKSYKDYSDTPTYVSRRAVKYKDDGSFEEVDLLDELAAGCSLGGPLPDWLVQRLRTGEVGA